jgi:hypothetical protein
VQYNTNLQYQELIDNREIWIIPLINPDGFVGEPGWGPTKYNANHVDLNRDAGYMWTGYFGSSPGPFAQPETKIMRDFILSRNLNVMIDYHSGIQGIIYPWFYRGDHCPDHDEVSYLANEYDIQSGYPAGEFAVTSGYDLYQTNGALIEFAYGSLGINAFCVELFNGFSGDGCIGMQYNRASILMMIEKAGLGIQGTVTDANTGNPVAAKISVQGKMAVYTSSLIGDYHKYLQPGSYTVTVSANGYDPQTINNINVYSTGSTILDFQLTPNSANYGAFKFLVSKNFKDGIIPADPGASWNATGLLDGLYYALGDTGYAVLDLGASIVNVQGPDIIVSGIASSVNNGYSLFVSSSMDRQWTFIGSGISTQSFELGSVNNVRYFRIEDNGIGPGNIIGAGFNLDAIIAVGTATEVNENTNISVASSYSAYPNPTHGIFHLATSNQLGAESDIRVYNILGQIVLQQSVSFKDNNNVQFDLSHLSKGIYIVQIWNQKLIKTIKIIHQ